jgi:hypothetical protein
MRAGPRRRPGLRLYGREIRVDNYYLGGALKVSLTDDPAIGRRYCVFINERAFHTSEQTARLLQAIAAESDLQAIAARFNEGRAEPLSTQAVRAVITGQLLPAGLVSTSPAAPPPPRRRSGRAYLFLSGRLLDAATVTRLSRPLLVLLSARLAPLLLLLCGALAVAWLCDVRGLRSAAVPGLFGLGLDDSLLLYGSLFASFLLHEFGHAAAARKYAAEPAEIGFGLYLIFPVLFCDVTDAWRLARPQRIVINLAGAYFQLIATALLVLAQALTGSAALGLAVAANLVSIAITLNPFLRFDGYWVYSDYFRLPNLRETSGRYLSGLLRRVLALPPGASEPIDATLALKCYAAGSLLFFSAFALFAGPAALHLLARLPQLVAAGAARLQQDHSLAGIATLLASGFSLLVYVTGCVLTLFLVGKTLLRGLAVLHGAWRVQREARAP